MKDRSNCRRCAGGFGVCDCEPDRGAGFNSVTWLERELEREKAAHALTAERGHPASPQRLNSALAALESWCARGPVRGRSFGIYHTKSGAWSVTLHGANTFGGAGVPAGSLDEAAEEALALAAKGGEP